MLMWDRLVRLAIADGQLPIWSPYAFGGQPLLATPAARVLYPPLVLTRLGPEAWGGPLFFAIHAAIFGIGAYLLLRRLGERRPVAMLAAAAVLALTVASPQRFAWPGLPAVAWLPLLIEATLAGASGRRWLPAPRLVLILSAVLLGGSIRGALDAIVTIAGTVAFVTVLRWPSNTTRSHLAGRSAAAVAMAMGLTAVQTVPQLGFAASLRAGEVIESAAALDPPVPESDAAWRRLLPALRRHVTVSTCDRVRPSDLIAAGIPIPGGAGPYLPGYARFTALASGQYPVADDQYRGLPTAGAGAARGDLMAWLGVEYLVACDEPDPALWTETGRAGDVAVYRATTAPLAPAWSCAPVAVAREQLEYQLATHRYGPNPALASPRVVVHVRWAERTSEDEREHTERVLHLVRLRPLGDRTWQYELTDASVGNVEALVRHPLVEDTAHLNRRTFEPEVLPPPDSAGAPTSEHLVGASPCPDAGVAAVVRTNAYRGRTVVQATAPRDGGVVVLPRTFFPGMAAWVDGRRVAAMRVNLAFMAVPVPAGSHRVEVAYVPAGQVAGIGITAATLLIVAGAGWRSRTRR